MKLAWLWIVALLIATGAHARHEREHGTEHPHQHSAP